jgi:catechol 2,3-dioxygenase-like lactoylglutathione lyase family enzyme
MIKKMAFVGQSVRDVERAKKFYGETLGLELDHDYGGGWAEYKLPGNVTVALDSHGPKMIGDRPQTCLSLEIEDSEGSPIMLHQKAAWRD